MLFCFGKGIYMCVYIFLADMTYLKSLTIFPMLCELFNYYFVISFMPFLAKYFSRVTHFRE